MKIARHAKILELIENYDIETQDELAQRLCEEGFVVTQATVSRDIREMKLTKIATEKGRQKYAVITGNDTEVTERLTRVFKEAVLKMDYAQNMIVVKTLDGMGMAVAVALGIGLLIKPGMGLDMSQIQTAEVAASSDSVSFAETLLNIIPKNPIGALANGEMLQVIVFALIVGVILAKLQDKTQLVTNFFQQGNDIMMEMTMMVMGLAPIGVFCLIAKTFAGLGFSAMVPMFKYMGAVLLALVIQCCGVYQILLALLTRLNPLRFLKKFAPVMGFAFSTATSNATIPMNIATLEEKIGVNRRISSFTIPLGATINMDGTSIMQGVAVVFVAQAFGIQLSPADYLTVIATATLASIGTAGVPSVGLVTLAMVFDSVGLPVAGIGLIMGIDRILDMARTAVNITGDAVCTTIVAHQDGALDKSVFNKN